MKTLYLVTGADGHLGSTIIRLLRKQNRTVRGLLIPGKNAPDIPGVRYFHGDVRDLESMRPLFENAGCRELAVIHTAGMISIAENVTPELYEVNVNGTKNIISLCFQPLFENAGCRELAVIHTAGMISIAENVTPELYEVNVNGTKNIISLCFQYKVKRLLYVSSVHAIPEQNKLKVLHETTDFSPDLVEGAYAKTKAEATKAVLDAVQKGLDAVVVHPSGILGPFDTSGNHLVQMVTDYTKTKAEATKAVLDAVQKGLDAVVVHPSGILGPFDTSGNHLVQMVTDYIEGRLPACVNGGYDFVDVRDVADGCLAALERGKKGECYILSNRHYEIKDVLRMVKMLSGGRRLPVLPMWMAKMAAPLIGVICRIRKRRPLYTRYSLYTLQSNDRFDHTKATSELGFKPRDLFQTIADTITWLKKKGHSDCEGTEQLQNSNI